jgi:hypothetical protein
VPLSWAISWMTRAWRDNVGWKLGVTIVVFIPSLCYNSLMSTRSLVKRSELVAAIRMVQARLTWKPGSAEQHVKQRIRRGHLPATATLVAYENIIQTVIHSRQARVYIFWYNETPYISVVDDMNDKHWLVMFALNGVLESAYIVERPDRYLSKPEFEYVGVLAEVTSHDDE